MSYQESTLHHIQVLVIAAQAAIQSEVAKRLNAMDVRVL